VVDPGVVVALGVVVPVGGDVVPEVGVTAVVVLPV
jgi:hypothetical protein